MRWMIKDQDKMGDIWQLLFWYANQEIIFALHYHSFGTHIIWIQVSLEVSGLHGKLITYTLLLASGLWAFSFLETYADFQSVKGHKEGCTSKEMNEKRCEIFGHVDHEN